MVTMESEQGMGGPSVNCPRLFAWNSSSECAEKQQRMSVCRNGLKEVPFLVGQGCEVCCPRTFVGKDCTALLARESLGLSQCEPKDGKRSLSMFLPGLHE